MASRAVTINPPGTAPAFDSVTAYLSWDHERLDAFLAKVEQAVKDQRFEEARSIWQRLESGLDRHIRLEEELVFPVFEVRSGISSGPTMVMRVEHREIRRSLGLMRVALVRGDAGGFREARAFLATVIPRHNAKEEHILYPATDSLLTPRERAAFLARLQSESPGT